MTQKSPTTTMTIELKSPIASLGLGANGEYVVIDIRTRDGLARRLVVGAIGAFVVSGAGKA